ncbi:MAG: methylated-DNA--[protein]-cysteine S-methyltransferase [Actinomycetota bacterium]|nr:methylated-DNA--[protein]-cysteine S-methyltransferase [Actinomycetota bacterium]
MKTPTTAYTTVASPLGDLLLTGDDGSLSGLYLPPHKGAVEVGMDWRRDDERFSDAREQLAAYFAGELRTFHLDLAPHGTAFQLRVWQALAEIPYGTTISYRQLAERVGNPNASRAVGLANGRNPISIVVPCHRVIGANGALVGYGAGVERKRWLLAMEGTLLAG